MAVSFPLACGLLLTRAPHLLPSCLHQGSHLSIKTLSAFNCYKSIIDRNCYGKYLFQLISNGLMMKPDCISLLWPCGTTSPGVMHSPTTFLNDPLNYTVGGTILSKKICFVITKSPAQPAVLTHQSLAFHCVRKMCSVSSPNDGKALESGERGMQLLWLWGHLGPSLPRAAPLLGFFLYLSPSSPPQ